MLYISFLCSTYTFVCVDYGALSSYRHPMVVSPEGHAHDETLNMGTGRDKQ